MLDKRFLSLLGLVETPVVAQKAGDRTPPTPGGATSLVVFEPGGSSPFDVLVPGGSSAFAVFVPGASFAFAVFVPVAFSGGFGALGS